MANGTPTPSPKNCLTEVKGAKELDPRVVTDKVEARVEAAGCFLWIGGLVVGMVLTGGRTFYLSETFSSLDGFLVALAALLGFWGMLICVGLSFARPRWLYKIMGLPKIRKADLSQRHRQND